MASGGAYRIESSSLNKEFQAPETTVWSEQNIADGLNGIPVNSSYKLHTWNFSNMLGCDHADLMTLFLAQQDGNIQLDEMETDPYDSALANAKYGTQSYNDFLIKDVSPKTRGQPLYDSVTVVFEVFVS